MLANGGCRARGRINDDERDVARVQNIGKCRDTAAGSEAPKRQTDTLHRQLMDITELPDVGSLLRGGIAHDDRTVIITDEHHLRTRTRGRGKSREQKNADDKRATELAAA
jgi:hypothetical protein